MKSTNSTSINVLNTISIIVLQIVTILCGFITPTFIIINYGSDANGLVNTVNQIIVYLSLMQLGLSSAVTYSLYSPLAIGETNKINEVMSAANEFYKKTSFAFLFVSAVIVFTSSYIFKLDGISDTQLRLIFASMMFPSFIDFLLISKYRMLLIADIKNYILSIGGIVGLVISTFLVVFFAGKVNLLALRSILIIQIIFQAIYIKAYASKKYKFLSFKEKFDKSILNKRWGAFGVQLISIIQQTAPLLFISLVLGLKSASLYSIYAMIILGIVNIVGLVNSSYIAVFGSIIAKRDVSLLKKRYEVFLLLYYFVIAVLFSILISVFIPFIKIYTRNFSDMNYINETLGILMILEGFFSAIRSPQGVMFNAGGLFKESIRPSIIQTIILIFFASLLGVYFGLSGVIIGMIIAHVYRNFELVYFVKKNVVDIKSSYIYKLQLVSLLMVTTCYITSQIIPFQPSSYFVWLIYSCIVGIIALALCLVAWLLLFHNAKSVILNLFRKVSPIRG